jgi:hypothetical protein
VILAPRAESNPIYRPVFLRLRLTRPWPVLPLVFSIMVADARGVGK